MEKELPLILPGRYTDIVGFVLLLFEGRKFGIKSLDDWTELYSTCICVQGKMLCTVNVPTRESTCKVCAGQFISGGWGGIGTGTRMGRHASQESDVPFLRPH